MSVHSHLFQEILVLLSLFASVWCSTACDTIRSAVATARTTPPSGARIYGVTSQTETAIIQPGEIINADIYLFNNATLLIGGNNNVSSSVITITGNIYISDYAQLAVYARANVDFNQVTHNQYAIWTLGQSKMSLFQCSISHGSLEAALKLYYMCGRSVVEVGDVDWSKRNSGQPNFWPDEQSTLTVSGGTAGRGPLEITSQEQATVNIANSQIGIGVYWMLAGTIKETVKLVPGNSVTMTQTFTVNNKTMSTNIDHSAVLFGLWLGDNTRINISDSDILLFPSLQVGGDINGLKAGYYGISNGTETVTVGTLSISFLRSHVSIMNLYLGGNSQTFRVHNTQIGETNCQDGATCIFDSSSVDGTGGFFFGSGQSELFFNGGSIATSVNARDDAVIHLTGTNLTSNPSRLALIQTSTNGIVFIVDTPLNGYTVQTSDNSAVIIISLPVISDTLDICKTENINASIQTTPTTLSSSITYTVAVTSSADPTKHFSAASGDTSTSVSKQVALTFPENFPTGSVSVDLIVTFKGKSSTLSRTYTVEKSENCHQVSSAVGPISPFVIFDVMLILFAVLH